MKDGYMTLGRAEARRRKVKKAMETPTNYNSAKRIKDREDWNNIKDDNMGRY